MPVSFKTLFLTCLFITLMGEIGPAAAGGLFLICWVVFFLVDNLWVNIAMIVIMVVTVALPAAILAGVIYAILYKVYVIDAKPSAAPQQFDSRGRPIEDAEFTEVA